MAIAIRHELLEGVGLSGNDLAALWALEPNYEPLAWRPDRQPSSDSQAFHEAALAVSRFLERGQELLDRLPPRPRRSENEQAAAEVLSGRLRLRRLDFLRRFAACVYADLTNDLRSMPRVEELVYLAAERVPGLVPSR